MCHEMAHPLGPSDPQERLEKEKKLTSDLGCAATKLQELLKTTQEQLAKERETMKKLQEQLDETVSVSAPPKALVSPAPGGGPSPGGGAGRSSVWEAPGLLGCQGDRRPRPGGGT